MRSETLNKKKSRRRRVTNGILSQIKEADAALLTVTLILAMYGLVMVFSASYYFSISENGNPFYYLIRDGIWVIAGIVLMGFGTLVDYKTWNNEKLMYAVLIGCLLLLVLVLTPIGTTANDATRWIKLGPITIMPGEISKIGMIFFTAWFFSANANRVKQPVRGLLPIIIIMGLFAFMIYKQPNLSTAITLCGIVLVMMLVAGMKWKYLFGLMIAGVVVFAALIFIKGGYWLERVTTFTHPFDFEGTSGYQIVQGLQALGSGGVFGVGLGRSVTKSLYLPYPHNDFIIAIIGEETGYVGILILLVLYSIFIWRGAKIALNCKDEFGLLIASGTIIMVGIQVVMNLAVVTSSMPATGVNLPFVSYGGNALMLFMFMSGVMLNISRHNVQNKIRKDA